jgi:hypothetical protein
MVPILSHINPNHTIPSYPVTNSLLYFCSETTKWQVKVTLEVSSSKEKRKLEHEWVRNGTVMLFAFQFTTLETKVTARDLSHMAANKDGEY